ncbi:hypothetical protein BCR42DRAFT_445001 [Absidia repens]|uniref:Uncharacterized protein n=1 Tax=Absidia repens TaxID=90262 RepID=A0A1X2J0A2_9FUNG|nr:hypothetical protein BCR42DRAFT_445001 [Absidia repens]
MPQPILPTIHSRIHVPETTLTSNVPPSLQEIDKGIVSGQQQSTDSLEDDPLWMKCKSVVFHSAGRVQSKLGAVTGMDGLTHRGQAWESWAAHASDHADFLTEHGATSRWYGEYHRWTGYVGKMLGQMDRTTEMQYNDAQCIDQVTDSMDFSNNKSSA